MTMTESIENFVKALRSITNEQEPVGEVEFTKEAFEALIAEIRPTLKFTSLADASLESKFIWIAGVKVYYLPDHKGEK